MAGRKVFIAKNAEEFRRVAAAACCGGRWLVQEIIPGPESAITVFGGYIAKDGGVRQAFTGRKLRQYPPGFGSASLARSEKLEETRRLSEGFLSAAGFRGIASAEFKYDERDGKLKIIEVNPRPALWFALSHHAGKRIALAAFKISPGDASRNGSRTTGCCGDTSLKTSTRRSSTPSGRNNPSAPRRSRARASGRSAPLRPLRPNAGLGRTAQLRGRRAAAMTGVPAARPTFILSFDCEGN